MRILKTGDKTSREICRHHQVRFGPHFLHSLLSRDSFTALHHLALMQDCREKPARDWNSPIKDFCSINITFTTVSNHSSPSTQWHRPQRARKSVFFLFTGAPLTTRLNCKASRFLPKAWSRTVFNYHAAWLPHHLCPAGRMDLSASSKHCECRKQSLPKDSPWPWSSLLKRHGWPGTTVPGKKAVRFSSIRSVPQLQEGNKERSSCSTEQINALQCVELYTPLIGKYREC